MTTMTMTMILVCSFNCNPPFFELRKIPYHMENSLFSLHILGTMTFTFSNYKYTVHISISVCVTIKESHDLWYDFSQLGRQTLRILDPLVQP